MRSLLPLLLAGLVLQGCTSFELTRLRNDVARAVPEARIGPGYAGALGPLTLGTARTALRTAPHAYDGLDLADDVLSRVERVQVGHYAVRGSFDGAAMAAPRALDRYRRAGWYDLVTVRDGEARTWILARERRQSLRDLLVVVLSEDGLTLARLSGDLTGVVSAALAEYDRSERRGETRVEGDPSSDSDA